MILKRWLNAPKTYWTAQAILLAPLVLLWMSVGFLYANKSSYLLKTVFGAQGERGIIVVVFGLLSIFFGVHHLGKTPAEKQLEWMLTVGLGAFAALTLVGLFSVLIN